MRRESRKIHQAAKLWFLVRRWISRPSLNLTPPNLVNSGLICSLQFSAITLKMLVVEVKMADSLDLPLQEMSLDGKYLLFLPVVELLKVPTGCISFNFNSWAY